MRIDHLVSWLTPAFVPRPHTIGTVEYENSAEYDALTKALNLPPRETEAEKFQMFLRDQNIPVYDLAKVVRYMDLKAARHNHEQSGWVWKPLRRKDALTLSHTYFGTRKNGGRNYIHSDWFYSPDGEQLYTHPLPLHALQRIALIEEKVGGGLHVAFLVSDYAARSPDPFLMVALPKATTHQGRFVIDYWDEPGFGLKRRA